MNEHRPPTMLIRLLQPERPQVGREPASWWFNNHPARLAYV